MSGYSGCSFDSYQEKNLTNSLMLTFTLGIPVIRVIALLTGHPLIPLSTPGKVFTVSVSSEFNIKCLQ